MPNLKRYAARRNAVLKAARLQAKASRKPVDAMVITDLLDIRYLTGLVEGGALLVVFPRGQATLVVFNMFQHVAAKQTSGVDIVTGERPADASLPKILRGKKIAKLGYQQDKISLARYQQLAKHIPERKLAPIAGSTDLARAIKDEQEIAMTQKCVKIAERAFRELIQGGKKSVVGRTEKDLAAELEYRMRKLGADRQAFSPGGIIVAAGPNSASCHHVPTTRKVKANDVLLIDWGAELDGYRSDITRTLIIGKAPARVIEMHRLINQAVEASVAALKPGIKPSQLDKVARGLIDETGHGDKFIHSLGHGVGLEIHEPPFLGRGDMKLKAGMIVTIEPGVYFDGDFGIRLEDDLLITPTGATNLNKLPRTLKAMTLA